MITERSEREINFGVFNFVGRTRVERPVSVRPPTVLFTSGVTRGPQTPRPNGAHGNLGPSCNILYNMEELTFAGQGAQIVVLGH